MGLEGLITAAGGLATPGIEINCADDRPAAVGDVLRFRYRIDSYLQCISRQESYPKWQQFAQP